MKIKNWNELNCQERQQVIQSYAAIRAVEEEIHESEVDVSGVVYCDFELGLDGYLNVII